MSGENELFKEKICLCNIIFSSRLNLEFYLTQSCVVYSLLDEKNNILLVSVQVILCFAFSLLHC
jgi:hypothetical protein